MHCEIVEHYKQLKLVQVGRLFHIVDYDEETNEIAGVYSADARTGTFFRTVNFTPESIRSITKGRKMTTAKCKFLEIIRFRKRVEQGSLILHSH